MYIVVWFTFLRKECGDILDDCCSADDTEHLHATAEAQKTDVMFETVVHKRIVVNVACGVIVALSLNPMPRLGICKECRADIFATSEDDGIHSLDRITGIAVGN